MRIVPLIALSMLLVGWAGCFDEERPAADLMRGDWPTGTRWTWEADDAYWPVGVQVDSAPIGWDGPERTWLSGPMSWLGQGAQPDGFLDPFGGYGLTGMLPGTLDQAEAFLAADPVLTCPSRFYAPVETPLPHPLTLVTRFVEGRALAHPDAEVTYEGTERVKTPAGTFDSHVFGIFTEGRGGRDAARAMTLWYAPEVGHVAKAQLFDTEGADSTIWRLTDHRQEDLVSHGQPVIVAAGTDLRGRVPGQGPGEFEANATRALPSTYEADLSTVSLTAQRVFQHRMLDGTPVDPVVGPGTGLDPLLWELEWHDASAPGGAPVGTGPSLKIQLPFDEELDVALYAVPAAWPDCIEDDVPDPIRVAYVDVDPLAVQIFEARPEAGPAESVALGEIEVGEGASIAIRVTLAPESAQLPDRGALEVTGPAGEVARMDVGPEPLQAIAQDVGGGPLSLVWHPRGSNDAGSTVLTGHTVTVTVLLAR